MSQENRRSFSFNVLTVRNDKIVRKVEFTQRSKALEAAGLRE